MRRPSCVLGAWSLFTALSLAPASAEVRARPPDLVVLSDLHTGEGRDRLSGKTSPMEDFRAERQLVGLVDYLVRRQARAGGRKLELVIAGDAFELLNVVHPPAGKIWPEAPGRVMGSTEPIALLKARRIIEGHGDLFAALGRLVRAGHSLTVLAGNHDLEIHFPTVQALFRQAIARGARGAAARVQFAPSWLLAREGVMIEHGNRYDPLNGLEQPGQPFERPGKVRTPAGSVLVYRFYQPLKEKVPELTKNNLRPRVLLQILRHLPTLARCFGESVRELVHMARAHRETPHCAAREDHTLPALARELAPVVNANRAAHGKAPLRCGLIRQSLERFQALAGETFPVAAAARDGMLAVAARMLRPRQLLQLNRAWSTYPRALQRGRHFALDELDFDVHICGHSHNPLHRIEQVRGRPVHVVDTGTWSHRSKANRDTPSLLTFAEVVRTGTGMSVKLRRWDAEQGRAVLIRPTR